MNISPTFLSLSTLLSWLTLQSRCLKVAEWWIKNLKPIFRRPLEGQELTANEQNKLRKYLSRVSCRILNNKQTTMRTRIKLLGILKLFFYLSTTKGLISKVSLLHKFFAFNQDTVVNCPKIAHCKLYSMMINHQLANSKCQPAPF